MTQSSYQKITSKAVLYSMPANQNDAPVYRILSKAECLKLALKVVKGDLK